MKPVWTGLWGRSRERDTGIVTRALLPPIGTTPTHNERDEATCKGLIRWYKTKTGAATWFGSAWVEDEGWKYGTAQGYNSTFKKTGEWINLGDIVYWGFDLNDSASNKGKLRKHDIQVIMFEIQRYFSSQTTS